MFAKGDDCKLVNFQDLFVGGDIYVYGKNITLYDCDDYTREFYNVTNI